MKAFFLIVMAVTGTLCLFLTNFLYVGIPIIPSDLFDSYAGPDGLGVLAGFILLVKIVAPLWIFVIIAGATALIFKLVPKWYVIPLILVVLTGTPVAWSAYQLFQGDRDMARERKEDLRQDDESVWKILQQPEIKAEIDSLVLSGAPVEHYTDTYGRSIVMPTFINNLDPFRARRMIDSTGSGSNTDGKGSFSNVTVYHLSKGSPPSHYSIYYVYQNSGEVVRIFDGLSASQNLTNEHTWVKRDSAGIAHSSLTIKNVTETRFDFSLRITDEEHEHIVAGTGWRFDDGGYYEDSNICILTFENLGSNVVSISANSRCGTSAFPETVLSGRYELD